MKIIQPYAVIESATPFLTQNIEGAIRTCYKSEDRIEPGSDVKIIETIKTNKHESCLEHGAITVRFICDRGITHELVRHRLAAYSQESTRYCTYSKDKFGSEITVIDPFFFIANDGGYMYNCWKDSMQAAETYYLNLLNHGAKAQEARSVLPNSLKTEIVMTANPREWRHVFTMRTSNAAHPQIRQIMVPLAHKFGDLWPVLFGEWNGTTHECPAEIQLHDRVAATFEFEKSYAFRV